jgi:hypothetical protein
VRSFTRACVHLFQPCTPFERARETDHSANEAAANPSCGVLSTSKRRCSFRRRLKRAKLKRGPTRPFLAPRKPCTIAPDRQKAAVYDNLKARLRIFTEVINRRIYRHYSANRADNAGKRLSSRIFFAFFLPSSLLRAPKRRNSKRDSKKAPISGVQRGIT